MKRSRPKSVTKLDEKEKPQKRQKTDCGCSMVGNSVTKKSGQKFTRPEKTDFTPLYKKHKAELIKAGCNVDAMIALRQKIHKHPEGAFNEWNTRQTIIDTLVSFGIDKKSIKDCAKTGLVVDIQGTGPKSNSKVKCVALRTDMDALPIPEMNNKLPYCSVTDHAHMCGHDGHMAMLLAGVAVLQKHRNKIGSNQKVRLLFQPAEEGPGGAKPMVEQGALNTVDEVYGLHNIPFFDEGDIRVRSGADWAQASIIKIRIIGQGGHGSAPHKLVDPISCAMQVFEALHTIKARNIDSSKNVVINIGHVKSGSIYNVFPDEAIMEGQIKCFDQETHDHIEKRIKQITTSIATAMECTAKVDVIFFYPPTINAVTETEHIKRLATKHFGPQHFSEESLPTCLSEDFSYFLQKKPGSFFCLGTLKPGHESHPLHTSTFNFNDDMVATGGWFWVRLVEDRLGVSLM